MKPKNKLASMMAMAMASSAEEQRILDMELPLSKTCIWGMLEQVYREGGKGLWENIPYYVTSSTFIAQAYAELILYFLLDYANCIDRSGPVYILEMGTGSGCLSFSLLKELYYQRQYFPQLKDVDLRYLMTDFSRNTIDSWLQDEQIAEHHRTGVLDFAIFKPEEQNRITTFGDQVLSPETLKNPVIVIANYFFDSLRQDAFRVQNHKLQEVLHSFSIASDSGVTRESLSLNPDFAALEKHETYVDVALPRYELNVLNEVLSAYEQGFDNATIIFPVGAFKCLENLRALTGDRFVLISSDKGFTDPNFMLGLWEQSFCAHHGIFSYPVNYDAIGRYINLLGGLNFSTNLWAYSVETQMSILLPDKPSDGFPLTHHYFTETVAKKNPINYLYFAQNILLQQDTCAKPDLLKAYIGFVRTCNCDPIAFYLCADMMYNCLSEAPIELKTQLAQLMNVVEQNYYHVRNRNDVPYHIGKLRYMLDDYDGSLAALRRSIAYFGVNSFSAYYAAACCEMLNQAEDSLQLYKRALALDPKCEVTQRAVERMEARVADARDLRR